MRMVLALRPQKNYNGNIALSYHASGGNCRRQVQEEVIAGMRSTVLCYNLKGTKKGKQIGMIFGFLGYKVRHVEPAEYLVPIGILAGIDKSEPEMGEYAGEGFAEEMLVMNAATEEMLDKALFLMKKEKVQVGLKAVITPANSEWTSLALHDEIWKEHRYMSEMNKKEDRERKAED